MAVVNQYKFVGIDDDTSNGELNPFGSGNPFSITSSSQYKSCRARGRSVAVKISNTAIDSNWKLGTFRLDVHAGGRR